MLEEMFDESDMWLVSDLTLCAFIPKKYSSLRLATI
jgi:hypothetical protein